MEYRRCITEKAIIRFKHRVRQLTRRHRGITLEQMIRELVPSTDRIRRHGAVDRKLALLFKTGKQLREKLKR